METVLAPGPLVLVTGRVRPGGQLGQRHRGDGGMVGQQARINDIVIDHGRGGE